MASTTLMKYAESLADVAEETNELDRARQDLDRFARIYEQHEGLQEALMSPAIPLKAKKEILRQIADKVELTRIVLNFLLLLLDRNRMRRLEEVSAAYQDVLDERAGIAKIEVLSSYELSHQTRKKLSQVMTKVLSKDVKITYQIDQDVIGGLRIRAGSLVFDGTIQTQLEDLRRSLVVSST
jgi:F-type H+-transporting ATPase subunit delta